MAALTACVSARRCSALALAGAPANARGRSSKVSATLGLCAAAVTASKEKKAKPNFQQRPIGRVSPIKHLLATTGWQSKRRGVRLALLQRHAAQPLAAGAEDCIGHRGSQSDDRCLSCTHRALVFPIDDLHFDDRRVTE